MYQIPRYPSAFWFKVTVVVWIFFVSCADTVLEIIDEMKTRLVAIRAEEKQTVVERVTICTN